MEPTCPKCGGHSFDAASEEGNFLYYIVYCTGCGHIIGVFPV
jgi:predicted nucleic-acid-binding Zn-ribbon protein